MKEVPIWEKSNLSLEEAALIPELVSISCVSLPMKKTVDLSCGLAISG